jgi:E3 ubiquitin-protein ligase BRE1
MEFQRELKKKMRLENGGKKAASSVGGSSSEQQDDAAMLDLTLGMLRCSVCRDRFKQVAITRCYHLFCKECIDENLRNRHRKCPACGEKFGQDDVKTIFFGN